MKNKKNGFALLLAVVITSIILAVALGISGVALKEAKFSTSAKDSTDAYYIADSVRDCVLFNDKTGTTFATSGDASNRILNCFNKQIQIPQNLIDLKPAGTSTFDFTISGVNGSTNSCAKVNVTKTSSVTTVTVKGYNVAGASCDTSNYPNAVERVLTYSSETPTTSNACPGTPTVTDSEGKTYPTVQIGSQCWMAKNLNVGTMINSTINSSNKPTIEKYCYGNVLANCDTYGGLYQWNEAMAYNSNEGSQGICPTGWHIPTENDFNSLVAVFSGIKTGFHLKNGPNDLPPWNGDNSVHFNGLNSGYFNGSDKSFFGLNNTPPDCSYSHFWGSGTGSSGTFKERQLTTCDETGFTSSSDNANQGFSIRCIQDAF